MTRFGQEVLMGSSKESEGFASDKSVRASAISVLAALVGYVSMPSSRAAHTACTHATSS
jgi:hypothetical protein